MAKRASRPEPAVTKDLTPLRTRCPARGRRLGPTAATRRTRAPLAALTRLNPSIRRCHNPHCDARLRPYRPEAEGRYALPRHEFGLDVVALIGRLRYAGHRSVPEI